MNKYFEYKDGKLFWKVANSNRIKVGQEVGNKGNNGYIEFQCNGKRFLTHRVIWKMFNGAIPKGLQIDHINGIRDDNRIENLQLVTAKQNQQRRFDGRGYVFDKYKINRPYKSMKWKKYIGYYGTPCGAYMASNTHNIGK